jgi:acetyltransferase-like isoleucine patch superfamily enzyme
VSGRLQYFLRNPLQLPIVLITKLPYFKFIRGTSDYQCASNFEKWFAHKVLNLGGNRQAYWPVHFTSKIYDADKIYAGVDTCPGFSGGCYITGTGGLYIGDYTQIAPNVTIVTANHDPYDNNIRVAKAVRIGKYCWIGAGAVILPGIELGDFTIVGAGAIVTNSFTDGYAIIGGNPAKVIKSLDPEKCVRYEKRERFFGYISEKDFDKYRKKNLKF